jgi:hypothetical protein
VLDVVFSNAPDNRHYAIFYCWMQASASQGPWKMCVCGRQRQTSVMNWHCILVVCLDEDSFAVMHVVAVASNASTAQSLILESASFFIYIAIFVLLIYHFHIFVFFNSWCGINFRVSRRVTNFGEIFHFSCWSSNWSLMDGRTRLLEWRWFCKENGKFDVMAPCRSQIHARFLQSRQLLANRKSFVFCIMFDMSL